ncbi:MAG: hypothetical protein COT15_05100 [Candidatus Diapherotrites archaeon CG08_land_8_20_14_0_20_34_12]|nr:MAG: hypothetical protein COT15_05100 [Candidatus Diapherotrites archaeon CG08_land_8_20_14_0_20_34_12]
MSHRILIDGLTKLKKAFVAEQVMVLRSVSNELMREASIKNDQLLAQAAMISYCLHKFLTKEHVVTSGFWLEYKMSVLSSLEAALKAIENDNLKEYKKELDSISVHLERLDKELGRYVQGTYEKAKVKYAADAYYYGLSLSQAAALTMADISAVQQYIGVTTQHDIDADKKGIKVRLDELKKVIGYIA